MALFPIGYGLFAVSLGQDANFDLRTYHYMDSYWAFVKHMSDIAPAGFQTYYSPFLDAPFAFAVDHLPARAVAFGLGVAAGTSAVPLYLIGVELFGRRWLALVLAALGMFAAGTWAEAGTIMGDNLTAPLYLLALWFFIRGIRSHQSGRGARRSVLWVAAGGALMGIAAGLKLVGLPWGGAAILALLLVDRHLLQRWRLVLAGGVALVGAFAVAYGPWAITMWTRYGNPILPFYNHVFQSPWAPPLELRDPRFVPGGILQVLFDPFLWTADWQRTGEIPFRELSIPIDEALLLALLLRCVIRSVLARRPIPMFAGWRTRFVVTWCVAGFCVWGAEFGIYRYLLPLEMLSFVVMFALVTELVAGWAGVRIASAAAAALAVACVLTESPGSWGREPFGHRYFTVDVPAELTTAAAYLNIEPASPSQYVIPSFPRDAFFADVGPDAQTTPYVHARIAAALAHYDRVYALWYWPSGAGANPAILAAGAATLAGFGLTADPATCRTMTTYVGATMYPVQYCLLHR